MKLIKYHIYEYKGNDFLFIGTNNNTHYCNIIINLTNMIVDEYIWSLHRIVTKDKGHIKKHIQNYNLNKILNITFISIINEKIETNKILQEFKIYITRELKLNRILNETN